jgi:hypothetical protein
MVTIGSRSSMAVIASSWTLFGQTPATAARIG